MLGNGDVFCYRGLTDWREYGVGSLIHNRKLRSAQGVTNDNSITIGITLRDSKIAV